MESTRKVDFKESRHIYIKDNTFPLLMAWEAQTKHSQ